MRLSLDHVLRIRTRAGIFLGKIEVDEVDGHNVGGALTLSDAYEGEELSTLKALGEAVEDRAFSVVQSCEESLGTAGIYFEGEGGGRLSIGVDVEALLIFHDATEITFRLTETGA